MSFTGRKTMEPNEFKSVRQKLNLTQDAFAIELGYEGTRQGNRTTIKRFENGARPISLPVAKLVFLLGIHGLPDTWPAHLEAQPAEQDIFPSHTEQRR